MKKKITYKPNRSSFGYCKKCKKVHSLSIGDAYNYALKLFDSLNRFKRLDFEKKLQNSDPRFSIDYLYGEALGQMFGILECEDINGSTVILKAFSGKYNGSWEIDGWVPPLFNVKKYTSLMSEGDKIITPLGREMVGMDLDSFERLKIHRRRKKLSQDLMKELHALYQVNNFRGEQCSIFDAFYIDKGVPTGTGDCCAPKLLNYAALNRLRPKSIAEFYYGKTNSSKTRFHGEFYSSCKIKCEPILGFMLCGAEDL